MLEQEGVHATCQKRAERNDQIKNMAAIQDKETGEIRHLTKDEKNKNNLEQGRGKEEKAN